MNIAKIQKFYDSDLGRYAEGVLHAKLKKTLNVKSKTVIGSLGAYAYMHEFVSDRDHLFFHTYQEIQHVPQSVAGRVAHCERYQWPHRAESIDAIVMGHDIEFADNIECYLREAWRVLKGEGKVFIIIPNRKGRWIRGDHTPFGYGQACHLKGLRQSLEKAHFKIDHVVPTLFFPPYEPKTRLGHGARRVVDSVGEYCGMDAGVYIIEVSKHIYAPTRGLKEMVSAPATKVLGAKATASSPKISE